jgi:integrase
MNNETRQKCISQGRHFIESRFGPGWTHIDDVQQALIDHAYDDNAPGKNSWYKKRRCLIEYYLSVWNVEDAFRIKSTPFPEDAPKKKEGTCSKKVSVEDFNKLIAGCMSKKTPDESLACSIIIAWFTGCRPSEFMTIEPLSDNRIHITGSKKTKNGSRGLDRTLQFDKEIFENLIVAIKHMRKELTKANVAQNADAAVKRLEEKLRRLNQKLFPRRKKHITFKSFRHQLGSNLKGSDTSRIEAAAIFGHQSVNSLNTYGDSRSGQGKLLPKASQESMDNVRVREVNNIKFLKQKRIERTKPKAATEDDKTINRQRIKYL